jgi:sugar-phosphatase
MEHAGIPAPESFVSADDVIEGKPSPEPYLQGARLLGLPPPDCLVVEDTAAGIESAKAAGMRVIALHTTYSSSSLQLAATDAVAGTLADVRAEIRDRWIRVKIEGRKG